MKLLYVFKRQSIRRSKTGTPLNQGNALKRHVRPAAEKKLGISLGGWHDFSAHTLNQAAAVGSSSEVVSDILGHKKVSLAMDVYDRTDVQDFVQPLAVVFNELLPRTDCRDEPTLKELVSAEGIELSTY